jgi:hypothetical protein
LETRMNAGIPAPGSASEGDSLSRALRSAERLTAPRAAYATKEAPFAYYNARQATNPSPPANERERRDRRTWNERYSESRALHAAVVRRIQAAQERQEARTMTDSTTSINPFQDVVGSDRGQDEGNARGHSDGVAPSEYGVSNAGPWSAANGTYPYDNVDMTDAGKSSTSGVLSQNDLAS